MSYIYVLRIEGAVRYVGQTKNVKRREWAHNNLSNNNRNHHRSTLLRKCIREGIPIVLEVIEETDDPNTRERWWIKFYKDSGANLVNGDEGGGHAYNSYGNRDKPWGDKTPIQRRMLMMSFSIRTMKRLGQDTSYLEQRVNMVKEAIGRVGKDTINQRLWDKYGR